jgi:CheY-like chemotaxis protein
MAARAPRRGRVMSGPGVPNPRLVLLVESDGPTQGEIIQLIRKLGYDGRAVAHGREAVTAVREAPLEYGLVLAELVNPGMDGGEVAERLREVRPSLPVVLLGGDVGKDGRELRAAYPELECFAKPLEPSALAHLLRRTIGSPAFSPSRAPQHAALSWERRSTR